ncbi:PHD and RING finger domain-containing protein 1-like isoform X1 [Entelurus aequoreus]|uniref:PHD and RING finger domain-containing protein 1-like isoform X1 n=1 Tax=Entelurus aequoreus TaxID=161455 RepID=UPI002B1CFFD0|nr:PHD and RING finger domain-containing protein 1-like isoform X1 [Entelurus aequoreus]
MDDDDSPDELINRRNNSKKTVAPWDISDDSDDVDGSDEGESDSGDEEEEENDGEGGGECNEEEDGTLASSHLLRHAPGDRLIGNTELALVYEDEEEDADIDDGVFGETSAAIAAMSSDEDADKCPICLNSFSSQPVATPENCQHYFCLDCILAWAKNANSCPVDRIAFNSIYLRKCYGGKVQKMITVQKPEKEDEEVIVDLDLDQTNCEVCQGSDREDRLLLCDGCDAGYHMECLTPPLDTVPVEEWFCPECVANNNNSEQENGTHSLASTAHPTTSRTQPRAAGPTRAIARTRHSERVRANVNRHRITQARTPQLAPRDLIQSTWLDDTINAVVAGLNTAVYVRDLTPRAPPRRKRKTGTRRKKASSAKGKKGNSRVKRRRKVRRRTKSRKTLVGKKVATAHSRIASSLGLSKDKKNCSLPTVCRPSEHTLSSMRADIGAASLSIHGDPFDLDPFVDLDENEHQESVTSLLEAKRRGISHSAFRSHQPVARPVGASLSRRGVDVTQTGGVVEAAPVPDLLGSILSGQSLLLMDSSNVVINRDGSLKASESTRMSALKTGLRRSSSAEESIAQADITPFVEEPLSNHHSSDPLGPFYQSSSRGPSSVNHTEPSQHRDLPPRGHLRIQQPRTNRPSPSFGVQRVDEGSREAASSSRHPNQDSKNKTLLPQSQPTKAPTKPMWVDVSILPRIPKIKRESSDVAKHHSSNIEHNDKSPTRNNTSGMPETALISFAGDENRKHHVVPQQSSTGSQAQRQGTSQAFSNSFSFSSSTGSQLCNSSVSSPSSSSVSFRINSSGNSWHSRRLSLPSSSTSGSSVKNDMRKKSDETRKRQLHRDKEKLLASRTAASNNEESNDIYDPFNPTASDSSSSDNEGERLGSSFHQLNTLPSSVFNRDVAQSKQKLVGVKIQTQENVISQEKTRIANLQTLPEVASSFSEVVKVEKNNVLVDSKTDNRAALSDIMVKIEQGLVNLGEDAISGHGVRNDSSSETPDISVPVHHSLDNIKTEEEGGQKAVSPNPDKKTDYSGSGLHSVKRKPKEEIKSDSRCSQRDLASEENPSTPVPSKQQSFSSSTAESDGGKTKDHHESSKGDRQKKMDRDRASRRSRSQERRTRSLSESASSSSPERIHRKRKQKSRSGSSSSSRERSRRKKLKQRSDKRTDNSESGRERRRVSKDNRRGRSRSRSRSRGRSKDRRRWRSRSRSLSTSRSNSRSKERRKEHTQPQHRKLEFRSKDNRRPRSRSNSRERRKAEDLSKINTSKFRRDMKKESNDFHASVKEDKIAHVKKDVLDSTIAAMKSDRADSTSSFTEVKTEIKKKGQQSIDMFEHSSITKHIKKEDTTLNICNQSLKKEPVDIELCQTIKTESVKREPVDVKLCQTLKTESIKNKPVDMKLCQAIKTESVKRELVDIKLCQTVKTESIKNKPVDMKLCQTIETESVKKEPVDIKLCQTNKTESIKKKPVDIKLCQTVKTEDICESTKIKVEPTSFELPVTSHHTAGSHQDSPNHSHLDVKANTVGFKVPIKQAPEPDEDVTMDVDHHNLDGVKPEHTKDIGPIVKQEDNRQEGRIEAEQVPPPLGAKAKIQGKRVTWNIQEPDGSQPDKSASKLARYKLKLKQEAARRPSSTKQTTTQDTSEPGSVSDSSKSEGASGEYLKKLHMQERAVEEVKLAIKPFYQKRDINKEEYKEILRKAVQKVCHSKSREINPVKVGILVKAYVDKYKQARKLKKSEAEPMKTDD